MSDNNHDDTVIAAETAKSVISNLKGSKGSNILCLAISIKDPILLDKTANIPTISIPVTICVIEIVTILDNIKDDTVTASAIATRNNDVLNI